MTIDIQPATLEWSSDLLLVRLKPLVLLTNSDISEIIAATNDIPGEVPFSVLAMIPEETDLDLGVMTKDHIRRALPFARVRAFALVTQSRMFDQLTHLYFAYYPTQVPVKIFDHQVEALEWISAGPSSRAMA